MNVLKQFGVDLDNVISVVDQYHTELLQAIERLNEEKKRLVKESDKLRYHLLVLKGRKLSFQKEANKTTPRAEKLFPDIENSKKKEQKKEQKSKSEWVPVILDFLRREGESDTGVLFKVIQDAGIEIKRKTLSRGLSRYSSLGKYIVRVRDGVWTALESGMPQGLLEDKKTKNGPVQEDQKHIQEDHDGQVEINFVDTDEESILDVLDEFDECSKSGKLLNFVNL